MIPEVGGSAEPSRVLATLGTRAGAQASAENFPVALRLLPRTARAQLTRVYLFARFVDDVGDEAPGDRAALLELVAADVRRLGAGERPTLAPVAALGPVVAAGVPLQPFLDLVAANVRDQQVHRYATFDDLLGYCRLSAAPVGRVVLHLAGAADDRNIADSDAVCHALQVLEHCQDVGEDARAGRVYLPSDELAAAGVADAELIGTVTSPALRAVVARQVGRAADLLRAGPPLVRRQRGWARLAVAGYVAGGRATADALSRHDYDVLAHPITPARSRTVRHAVPLLVGRR